MIIVNRVAELIIKYRSSDLTKEELQELGDWLGQSFEHLYLFRDLTDDDYLCGECARMLEGDKETSWKKIEQKLFNTLSDAPRQEEPPAVSLPDMPGGPPPAYKQKV